MNNLMKFALVLTVVFFIVFALFSYPTAEAQTTNVKRPTTSPTPPKVSVSPSPTPAEEDNEVIRIDTELVNLNVRVIDRNNRPINNLQQKDFKVYEDGVLQQVEYFSKAEVPTNYALVVDNSGSMRFLLEKVIEASKIVVNTNRPDDETGVVRFVSSDKIEVLQDFTANKTDLNDALENMFVEGGQTAVIDAVYLAAEKVDQHEKSRNPNERRRRALILISDGEDRDSFYKEKQLFDLLSESEVQIYVVGFTSELSSEGGFISKSPRAKAEAFLKRLADATGGKAYFPKGLDELNGIAKDIASELRTQYLVSYVPSNDKKDGTFRNIKVVVDDGPNKQKRIAITRTGRSAATEKSLIPSFQKNPTVNPKP